MIVLLKIILGLLAVADVFALWNIFKDFQATRTQDGYDELSIWRRVKFNLMSFFMMAGMVSLFSFLVYFIIIKISLG
jgi:hypothetical protein